MSDIWGYQPTTGYTAGTNLTGYKVEATDGSIGKVDKHSDEVGSSCIVVDTGVWIFGKHVLLPAGTITLIDASEKKIHVSRTKAEIKDSPSSTRTGTLATRAITTRSVNITTPPASDTSHEARGRGGPGIPWSTPAYPRRTGVGGTVAAVPTGQLEVSRSQMPSGQTSGDGETGHGTAVSAATP